MPGMQGKDLRWIAGLIMIALAALSATGGAVMMGLYELVVYGAFLGGNRQGSPVGHCIPCICREIHQQLFYLADIGIHDQVVICCFNDKRDVFTNDPLQQLLHVPGDVVYVIRYPHPPPFSAYPE